MLTFNQRKEIPALAFSSDDCGEPAFGAASVKTEACVACSARVRS
jgi:hypothetical protein